MSEGAAAARGIADAWEQGFVLALAEVHRLLAGGAEGPGIRDICRGAGVTIASAKAAHCNDFDVRELERAGVAQGNEAAQLATGSSSTSPALTCHRDSPACRGEKSG